MPSSFTLPAPQAARAVEQAPPAIPSRREWAWMAAFAGVALVLRLRDIGGTPLSGDELHYAYDLMSPAETSSLGALRDIVCEMLIERRSAHPMLAPLLTRWLWFLPLGWALEWTPAFLRGFNVLVGALTVVPAAWAGYRAWGHAAGRVMAILVAVSPLMTWVARTLYLDTVFVFWLACLLAAAAESRWRAGWLWPAAQGMFFGLFLATKLSAPILAPAVAFGLFGLAPAGTDWRQRLVRTAVGMGVAALLFYVMCDPNAYLEHIRHPTDVRYRNFWDEGSYFNRAFITLNLYWAILMWEGPLTLALLATAGVATLWRKGPFRFWDAYVLASLACLSPLMFMHMLALSGPHGMAPFALLGGLLAARAFTIPRRRLLAGVLVAHVAASLTCVELRAREAIPYPHDGLMYPLHYPLYTGLKPWLHERKDPWRIAILIEGWHGDRHRTLLRNVELSEGAVIFMVRPEAKPDSSLWALVDVVAVPEEGGFGISGGSVPAEFEALPKRCEGWNLYARRQGRAAETIDWAQMDPLPARAHDLPGVRRHGLPGGLYPVTGHPRVEGATVERGRSVAGAAIPKDVLLFEGKINFLSWGTGEFVLPPEMEPGDQWRVRFAPPRREDVFWDL